MFLLRCVSCSPPFYLSLPLSFFFFFSLLRLLFRSCTKGKVDMIYGTHTRGDGHGDHDRARRHDIIMGFYLVGRGTPFFIHQEPASERVRRWRFRGISGDLGAWHGLGGLNVCMHLGGRVPVVEAKAWGHGKCEKHRGTHERARKHGGHFWAYLLSTLLNLLLFHASNVITSGILPLAGSPVTTKKPKSALRM